MISFRGDDYRRRDRLGRSKPHLVGSPLGWLLHIPGAQDRIRQVPLQAIAEESDHEVLIVCPCGSHPVIPRGEIANDLCKCSGCERWYIAHGDLTLVVYGDMPVPGARNAHAQGAVQD